MFPTDLLAPPTLLALPHPTTILQDPADSEDQQHGGLLSPLSPDSSGWNMVRVKGIEFGLAGVALMHAVVLGSVGRGATCS